tara:strand:+ start:3214 stop:4464 length:1251 start_codon:yes stop_codon:yes gene_type:complete
MNNNHYKSKICRLCKKDDLTSVLKLEATPPANEFLNETELNNKQTTYPLELYFCKNCNHIQLLNVVNPSILFEDYVYVSGTSPVFVNHFKEYANGVIEKFNPDKSFIVLDIGSNDGTLLSFFKNKNFDVLGIDPAKNISSKASKNGIKTIPEFFSSNLANKIKSKYKKASIITANNVFAHADNLDDIVLGIKNLLSPDGIFVFEVSYLVDVLEKNLFDTIYHEHLSYHSVGPLKKFFLENGLEMISAERINTHGGSLRGYVQIKNAIRKNDGSVEKLITYENEIGLNKAKTFLNFSRNIDNLKFELLELLRSIKSEGKTIAGFGAPAKATTLMYQFGIDKNYVDFIVDDSPLKQGLYSPGLKIPVLTSDAIKLNKPDYLIILAWNFSESIIKKNNDFIKGGGKFIVPLPKLSIIEK